jgi:hypothetical protein
MMVIIAIVSVAVGLAIGIVARALPDETHRGSRSRDRPEPLVA